MFPSVLNNVDLEVVHISRDYFVCSYPDKVLRVPVELVLYDLFYYIKGKRSVDIQQETLTKHVYHFLHDRFRCTVDPDFERKLNGKVMYIRDLNELPFVFDEGQRGRQVTSLDPSEFYKQFVYLWRRCLKFTNHEGHLRVSFTLNLSSASLSTEKMEVMERRLRLFTRDYIRKHGAREVPFIELQTVIIRENLKNYTGAGTPAMSNSYAMRRAPSELEGISPESLPYPFDYIHTSLRNNVKFRYINYGLSTDMSSFQYKPCWSVWSKKDLLGLLECEPYGLPVNEIEENNLGAEITELVASGSVWRLGSCKDNNTNVKKVTLFLAESIPEILKVEETRSSLKEEWKGVISNDVSYADKIAELKRSGEAFKAEGMRDEALFDKNKTQKKERQRKKRKICNKHLPWVTKEYEDSRKRRMETSGRK